MIAAIRSIRLAVAATALSLGGAPPGAATPIEPGSLGAPAGDILLLDQLRVRGEFPKDVIVEIGPAHTMQAVIEILNRHGLKFERSDVRVFVSQIPVSLMTELNKLPPGEPFVVPAGDFTTVNVIRKRIPAS